MSHLNDEELILFHYGETPDTTRLSRHLEACATCRAAYEALRALLAETAAWEPPPRDAQYGDQVWARVGPQLLRFEQLEPVPSARPKGRAYIAVRDLLRPRVLVLAGYGAALVLLVLVLVQYSPQSDVTSAGPPSAAMDEARERVLLSSLGDHFDRSQLMLLELANQREALDASATQAWAQDLLATNRLYRHAATSDGEDVMADVLDDLERVLLQVAHAPEEREAEPASLQATSADVREMLFKLRVAGDTVRARERAAFASIQD